MSNDNRISAVLSAEDASQIIEALATVRSKLPFLLQLSAQERQELSKMGDKSVGFDDKCKIYMESNPEFLPGYLAIEEIKKDRELRSQMMRFFADLISLSESVDDTLMIVSSEVWSADLGYYNTVREAARRGRPGAQSVYADLQQRFPGAPPLSQRSGSRKRDTDSGDSGAAAA